MITIFVTTNIKDTIQALIDSEYRLNELVQLETAINENMHVKVDVNITVLPDWEALQPPILLPIVPYNDALLLGILYAKLGNYERAYTLLQKDSTLLQHIDLLNRLQNGVPIEFSILPEGTAIEMHNKAVALHYGLSNNTFSEKLILDAYEKAIAQNTNAEQQQFSMYHLLQFHIDLGATDMAEKLIDNLLQKSSLKKIHIACKDLQSKLDIKKISVPYNTALLEKVKTNLWECLDYYEANNRTVEAAIVLMDASYIATISNSFSEALGYINRSIAICEAEQQLELYAQAQFSKGNLLQTWAQNGNPQFYRSAVQSYQSALRIFTKEDAPPIFAEIQHQLGRVYAEIPDEVKKKGVWAAVSVSSFNEALEYYNKIDFPYEFAMVCNSLGNAYTKFPISLHTDNYDKALAWYREALDIRTAQAYPLERVLTLSNYLEASWFAGNKDEFDEERYNDMMAVANEIIHLSTDPEMIENAQLEISKLKQLKEDMHN